MVQQQDASGASGASEAALAASMAALSMATGGAGGGTSNVAGIVGTNNAANDGGNVSAAVASAAVAGGPVPLSSSSAVVAVGTTGASTANLASDEFNFASVSMILFCLFVFTFVLCLVLHFSYEDFYGAQEVVGNGSKQYHFVDATYLLILWINSSS